MNDKITGGCLCGKVRFKVENRFERFYLCHCSQCRKITGSAFASNLITQADWLEWIEGEDNIKRYEYPDRDFTKAFCVDCGSGVPFQNKKATVLIVPAGSLDAEPNIIEQSNIFWAERPKWLDHGLESEHFDGFSE